MSHRRVPGADNGTHHALAGLRSEVGGPRLADMPPASRPREKLQRRGVAALTDAELLALLLGSGRPGENVLALAGSLMRRHGMDGLAAMTRREWLSVAGVGQARAARLLAAVEMGRRMAAGARHDSVPVTTPALAWQLLGDLGRQRQEQLVGLYLDGGNRLLARETLSLGTLNTTRTHPREILEPALRHLALGFILAHNHPGGSSEPSRQDVAFTAGIGRAARLMDIGFYDHLVVTREGYTSLRQRGLMPADGTW